ncbi:MAG: sugar kinase [Alkalinema sp. RU_4_3]|nr:sugar kinase [Alkalinema sp. RU_4_3]
MSLNKPPIGLFVGLTTWDLIYRAEAPPGNNQKIVASDFIAAAGGPATNASIAFQHLGGQAILLSGLGKSAIAPLIQNELTSLGLRHYDLLPNSDALPPLSSIVVTESTGDRAVVCLNATKIPATASDIPEGLLESIASVDIILLDGHQIDVGCELATIARNLGIPVVLDGGSWKPGLEKLLPWIDYAICSANFHPPEGETFDYLNAVGIGAIAITRGNQPIDYFDKQYGTIDVPSIQPVDTLGAGDIFHGAFCSAIANQHGFVEALAIAAQVAAHACQFFGTREWMQHPI